MYSLNTRRSNSRWITCLLFTSVLMSLVMLATCYDPCPESMRGSDSGRLPQISDEEIEEAFRKAEEIVHKRKQLELKLIREGRIIPRNAVTAESNHQPITSDIQVVREREVRQLRFQEASAILSRKYDLNAAQVSCGLPNLPLKGPAATRALEICTSNDTTTMQCDSQAKYRTADGTCNNLKNPSWGSALHCADRILLPNYTGYSHFRRSVRKGHLPPPRKLSLNVHRTMNKSSTHINHMYMGFGQLLAHDLTRTPPSTSEGAQTIQCCPPIHHNHPQCAPVLMKDDDPFYSQFEKTCFNFVRSASCRYCKLGPRCQVEALTAFIDASFAYGNSLEDFNITRSHDGTGTMLMRSTEVGDLLPPSFDQNSDRCSRPAQNQICFQSGDARVNQHALLTSLHTMFNREHNRIARNLSALNPHWDEETIFQESRKIVGAVMQVITYKEYLVLTIGEDRMLSHKLEIREQGTTYNPDLNPALYTEFTTAILRFGHATINSRFDEDPSEPGHDGHLLRDMFIYPFGLYTGEMDPLIRGVTNSSPAKDFNRHLVPDVTDFLYRIHGTPGGLDLASINIQRGRDHGLQGYTTYVAFCQQNMLIRSFDDLTTNQLMTRHTVTVLRRNYKSVQDIDLFTGIVSEIPLEEAVVGPTTACILGRQFYKLKFGDRFFFQHTGQPGSFTDEQMRELEKISLSKVICDNTNITEIQEHAMVLPSPNNFIVPCSQIPGIDLTMWKQ